MTAKRQVVGTLVDDVLVSDIPGAYRVTERRLQCNCPCGCGSFMNLPIHSDGQEKAQTPSWSWNGNLEKPTLQPSIRDVGSCYFHGYLTGGVWLFCSDSGVKTKGSKR